jgi:Ca-activated chloride channel homolog
MQRAVAAVLLGTALFSTFLATPAQSKLAMEIVYDASGSMWARIGDKERFLVLNKALDAFLEKVPDEVALALRVYGARQKGDCDDSELVVPFGTGNKEAIRAAVKKIRPLGKTPIQRSLLAAAEDLKGQEGTKIIVLVSDGKETCEGDPCDTARKLSDTEKIQIDVVGFAISNEETRRQLTCIATVGAGNYFDAASESDLNNDLSTSIGALAPPPPQKGHLMVRVDRPSGIQAPTQRLKIDVFEQSKPDAPAASFEGQNPVSADLTLGAYRVVAHLDEAEKSVENINIESNTQAKIVVEFPPLEGVLLVTAKSGGSVLASRVICDAFPAGQHEASPLGEQYSSLPMPLPEGNYDVRCSLLGASVATEVWQNNVAIRPGEKRELEIALNMGTLTVQALGPPNVLGDHQSYGVFPAGDHSTRLAWTYCGSAVELPAGTYDIQVEVGATGQRSVQWIEGVKVSVASPGQATADFRPGEILLSATTGGQTVGNEAKFTVYPPGDPKKDPVGWSYSGVPLQVPAGTYDALVEYQPQGAPLQKQWVLGLAVNAGQQLGREVEFATGQVQVHVFAGGQDVGREGGFSLYLPGEPNKPVGKYDNHSAQTVPTGSYDVRAESFYYQYGEWRKDVVVTKDKLTELKVDFPTGKLVISVMQGGKDLGSGATYYVYPQNEKFNHIAFAFSGTAIDLVPGVYDVKCTIGPTVKWKKGVFIEASETTKDTIDF